VSAADAARGPSRESGDGALAERVLGFGPATVALASVDAAAEEWLDEVLSPWFAPTARVADWRLRIASRPGAYEALRARRPPDAMPRACFAHDTRTLALPAWTDADGRVVLDDEQRSCLLLVEPSRVELVGDAASLRWRFTAMWVMHEMVATRLRPTHLDVHAAAVESGGRAILIAGPKGAGKTTLSFHLLRSRLCRAIANDRAFAGLADDGFAIRGVPTAIKLRPETIAAFPELLRGLPNVERPYLLTLAELGRVRGGPWRAPPGEIALSPAQIMRQLNVRALDAAPLGAIAFPELRSDLDGWTVEGLGQREVAAALAANMYGAHAAGPGARSGPRPATIFEQIAGVGGVDGAVASALSEGARGFRVLLGPNAYDDPRFAARLLDELLG
jgi:hypothetical protein